MQSFLFIAPSFLALSLASLASQAQPSPIDQIEVIVQKNGKGFSGPVALGIGESSAASARILTAGQLEVTCNGDQPRSLKSVDRRLGVRVNAARTKDAVQVEVEMLDFDEQQLPSSRHMEKCSAMVPPVQRAVRTSFSVPSGPASATQEANVEPGFHVTVKRTRVE